jgi:[acyl-carrier-protein] S-malonyltransferase
LSKIAFLFPGQGAQEVGMGRSWADQVPAAAARYERAREILGYDLAEICFHGPAEQLNSTVHSQPALFVTSLAAWEVLRFRDPGLAVNCQAAAGLSLGEYTALTLAGVLEFEDALQVVAERGRAMQDASDTTASGMVSVLGLDRERVEQLCDRARGEGEILQVANLLCPGNIAVSGSQSACERLCQIAQEAGAMKAVPLAVAGAFHTPIMQSAVDRLAAALQAVPMNRPRIPVISNVDARPHDDPEEIRQLLVQQVVQPVLWEDSLRWLLEDGCDEFYEVGPGRVLRGTLKRLARKVPCHSVTEAP